MTRTCHIRTFGCQMNKLDSSLTASALVEADFSLTERAADADVIVINTCSVREHAEARVLSHLGHLKHMKKTRPELVVAVIGCMAQRLGAELLEHPAVNIVCGPAQLSRLPQLINEALSAAKKKTGLMAVTENARRPASRDTDSLDEFERLYDDSDADIPGQAYVRAMHGCDRFCSYCVVPYVRGHELSRPPQAIRDQILRLVDHGVKQITLLGQTINSYSYREGDKVWRLADILEMAAAVEGVRWVRFITSYPADFDQSILRVMADVEKVCPYLHIPAQSGSDRILKAMNRHYTAAEYLALLDKARDIVPGISVAGDFIVGFPGETEQDFMDTCDMLVKSRYKNAFIFRYSPRPGTRAEERMVDDVPLEVKKERNTRLLELQNSISERMNRDYIGMALEVMVEGPAKKPGLNSATDGICQLMGRTATDHIVVFNGSPTLAGSFVKTKITRTSALTLFGDMVAE
ncbi:MAG TPA: tRNA (N6-isopentenyl adenosine(37)-C2)-methylthiotransferase MiaB [Sedimentisphaerales bacterium]|nr:tRNA (N6-isopentenyl adenosine(37)-C2)-methylthiotransferase MiaB [Sedimentisphaerales bacterium]